MEEGKDHRVQSRPDWRFGTKNQTSGGDDIHDQEKIKGQYDEDKLDKDAEAHPPTYDKIRKALIEKGIDPETPLAEIPKGEPPIIKKKK